jgi:hypothetical protein
VIAERTAAIRSRSHHRLRETIMLQTAGASESARLDYLARLRRREGTLIHEWEPEALEKARF